MVFTNYDALGLQRSASSSVTVDKLGAAYDKMKLAEAEYRRLRADVLLTGARWGDFYVVDVADRQRRRVDWEGLYGRFGKDAVDAFVDTYDTAVVTVRKRAS